MDGCLTCDFTMNTEYCHDLQLQLSFSTCSKSYQLDVPRFSISK